MFISKIVWLISAGAVLSFVCSCGGSGQKTQVTADTANVTVRLSAEPIPWIDDVVLQIRAVTFVRANDAQEVVIRYPEARQVSLLKSGSEDSVILAAAEVPVGDYAAVHLELDAATNVSDSYVSALGGGQCELRISDGSKALTARGTTRIQSGNENSLTIVANLHRSLLPVECAAGYVFRPELDLVDDDRAGWFVGGVDLSSLTPNCEPIVYVFMQGTTPDDLSDGALGHNNPVAMSIAAMRADGYHYRTRPLALCPRAQRCLTPARYLLALTCASDDPFVDENLPFERVVLGELNDNGGSTEVNF